MKRIMTIIALFGLLLPLPMHRRILRSTGKDEFFRPQFVTAAIADAEESRAR